MDLIEKNINDILDIKGKHNNFLNDKPYTSNYTKLAEKWSLLPMYADKSSVKKFFDLLHNCQVILLISGTGSGKTVIVPKFFLKYIKTMNLGGKIAITNPKILTTLYNAEYGATTLDVQLGDEVGYKYKGAPSKSSSSKSKLLYCTDGLILATILSGDSILSEYQGIIIDEAHERHVQIDMLLKLIKDILPIRPDFKLIIMSATINATIFRNYFNVKGIKFGEMEVSGESNFPIQQNWLDPKTKINRSNYLELAIDRCLKIINTSETGDIIIFVPTQNDTINGCKLLKNKCPSELKTKQKICDKLYCVEVYSKMKQANKDLAVSKDLYKKKGYERKIIFATNVAESSITFDGLVYVIDTGYELANYYEASDNSYVISKMFTSQAQVKQRIGRAGRTQAGISYHIYTQNSFNNFKLYPEPNISVVDLTDFVLSFINYAKTVKNMISIIKGLITIPKIEQILYAIHKLHFIKSLKLINSENTDTDSDLKSISDSDKSDTDKSSDTNTSLIKLLNVSDIKWDKIRSYDRLLDTFNGTSTSIGLNILKFRSSPILSALAIIMSKYMNCQNEIIKIMAIIEISDGKLESLFEYDNKELNKTMKYFNSVSNKGSDHLTALNIYNELYTNKQMKYLNKKSFDNIEKRIRQLLIYANSITSESYSYMNNRYNLVCKKTPYEKQSDNILYVIGLSHYYNLLMKEAKNIYTSINFMENSVASVEYFIFTPPIETHTNFIICNSLVNAFGRKNFKCISQIPDQIMSDIVSNEKIYMADKIKIKLQK